MPAERADTDSLQPDGETDRVELAWLAAVAGLRGARFGVAALQATAVRAKRSTSA